jgi:hypothetical protein
VLINEAYNPKPKTCHLNKDPPAVHRRKVGSRASKLYCMDNLAEGRSSSLRASQIGENDQLGTLSCCLVTSHASWCIKLVGSELIPGVVTSHRVLQIYQHCPTLTLHPSTHPSCQLCPFQIWLCLCCISCVSVPSPPAATRVGARHSILDP